MSKIVEFRIGKGITQRVPGSETEHTRKYLEVTVRLPEQITEEGFHEALARAEQIIDEWLHSVEIGYIPKIDIADVEKLPWMSYQTHEPCTKPDEAGWIWADPTKHSEENAKIVAELVRAIERSPKNKFQLGNMVYTFSGPKEGKRMFISRRKTKVGK